jgi:hypothetical protein
MTETDPEKRLIGYARVSTYGQTLDVAAAVVAGIRVRSSGAAVPDPIPATATGLAGLLRPVSR